MTENDVAHEIVDAAFRVHIGLGPGLLESAYQVVLCHELCKRGLQIETEVPIPVKYDGEVLEVGFRADILVENMVIVELKSVELIQPVHAKQLRTYLRLADKRLGLLINFNVELIKKGIMRVVNGMPD